ncbi:MAG: LytTR family transcriptional regulator DNA-binding domain-containing protein [Bacteroidaceae bacterium]
MTELRIPFFVRHAAGLKSISTDSIVYMEANACRRNFYLNDGSVVQVEMPLNMALSKITKTILRIHRSYAVNIEYFSFNPNRSLAL